MEWSGQTQRFSSVPNLLARYPSESFEKAIEITYTCLDRGEGVALVLGEGGLGKTLLLLHLAELFNPDDEVLFLSGRIHDATSLLQQILYQLHQTWCGCSENELHLILCDYLRKTQYKRIILLLDEASNFRYSVFEELRMLLDQAEQGRSLVRVALAGNHRLEERFTHQKLAAFQQRIVSRAWLEPFSTAETAGYLDREGARSGNAPPLTFTEAAKKQLQLYAEGVPRVINQIGSIVLRIFESRASDDRFETVNESIVKEAWSLLQQIPLEPEKSKLKTSSFDQVSSLKENSFSEQEGTVVEFGSLDDDDSFESENNNDGASLSNELDTSTEEPVEILSQESNIDPVSSSIHEEKDQDSSTVNNNSDDDELAQIYRIGPLEVATEDPKNYLNELEQLEEEVSREVRIIRQIRGMHHQMQQAHSNAYELAEEENRKKETSSPLGKRERLQTVYRQIYTDK